jgi:hypothetical protein
MNYAITNFLTEKHTKLKQANDSLIITYTNLFIRKTLYLKIPIINLSKYFVT